MALPTTHCCLLLLLLTSIAGTAYRGDEDESCCNDPPMMMAPQMKRASNLGSRLMCQLDSRNCGAFNLGKKFIGYSWLRAVDSRQRRTPLYFLHSKNEDEVRHDDKWWQRNYRY
uniref:Uncharacterized protein n=1 Tax=Clastoptera arizonana TaxID=38151 RepID=A0A1B6DUR7_9HEMI